MSIQEEKLTEIANAVRPKLGITSKIIGNDLAKKVGEIKTPTDGSIPTYQGSNVVYPSQSGTILATNQNYLTSDISVRGDQNFKAENIKKGVKIWNVTGTFDSGEKLPYTPIEYLETNGSNYIDTKFNYNPKTTRIVYEMEATKKVTWGAFFGGRINGNVGTYEAVYFYADQLSFMLQFFREQVVPMSLNTRYLFDGQDNKLRINGKLYSGTDAKYNGYLNYSLLLGTANENGTPLGSGAPQKIYKCQIWDNGVLVRDMIPCIYKGQKGMFDKVNEVFYDLNGGSEAINLIVKSVTLKNSEVFTNSKNMLVLSVYYEKLDFSISVNLGNDNVFSISSGQLNASPTILNMQQGRINKNSSVTILNTKSNKIQAFLTANKEITIYYIEV